MAKKAKKEFTLEEKLQIALVADWEQPYAVPKNWVWTRLGELAEVVSGGTPSTTRKEFYLGGHIAWICPSDLSNYNNTYISQGKKNITELGLQKSSAIMLPKNSIILSTRAPIGYVAIAKKALCTNQGFKNFLPSSAYNPHYLYWYLKGNTALLTSYASGTTFLELSKTKVSEVEFPLPPLAEQKRIVQRIESLFAKLDTAKELLEEALESFESRKSTLLHQAFKGELTKAWRKKHDVSMESWEDKKLGDITTIKSSKRIFANDYQKNGIPFYRSSEIVDIYDNGATQPQFFISEKKYNEIKERFGVPQQGDLLVTSVGTIGKTWLVDGREFYYKDGNLTQLASSTSFSMRYVQLFISSQNFIQQVNSTVGGTAYNALTIIKFKNIITPIPTLSEQEEIVRILDAQLQKEEEAKAHIQHSLEHIEHMKKAILARAFRGELGTNNPEEASAVELLKEILEKAS